MYIIGKHEKTIFFNKENGYIVALIRVKESSSNLDNKQIVWVGYVDDILLNNEYKLFGDFVQHPKYGRQFLCSKIEKLKPQTKEQIINYLSSDLFPGIGIKTAELIVEKLGVKAIEKIIDNEAVLQEINIAPLKREQIKTVLKDQAGTSLVLKELVEMGFSAEEAVKINNFYQTKTLTIIANNIYDVYLDIPEISFEKILNIASNENGNYVPSLIVYTLIRYINMSGDSYILIADLQKLVFKALNHELTSEEFSNYLQQLFLRNKLVIDDKKIYLPAYYDAEKTIITFLKKRLEIDYFDDFTKYIDLVEKQAKLLYNDEQKEVINQALVTSPMIITGGPGVGKTTVIKGIIEVYKMANGMTQKDFLEKVIVLAPTGRASKRLRELTGFPAMTIHRFLRWQKESNTFLVNEKNKAKVELVVVDEVSMIDLVLFASLLKSLKNNVKLILVGDFYQLSSVAPGNVLQALINSKKLAVGYLEKIFRQQEASFIPVLARRIKATKINEDLFKQYDDYFFVETKKENIKEQLKDLICEQGYQNILDFQVLAPIYRGINGIDQINQYLQTFLNPPNNKKELKVNEIIYRVGDKVIQLNNLPEEDIYNGDIGLIEDIIDKKDTSSGKDEIIVIFDEQKKVYYLNDLFHLKHAFCISIHKAQGSEFKDVFLPITPEYNKMLHKLLLYTAVTRAREKLFLVGNANALVNGIKYEKELKRQSFLKERIINEL